MFPLKIPQLLFQASAVTSSLPDYVAVVFLQEIKRRQSQGKREIERIEIAESGVIIPFDRRHETFLAFPRQQFVVERSKRTFDNRRLL
jgi:hypothetical protein